MNNKLCLLSLFQGKVSDIDEAKTMFRSISHPDVITHNAMSKFGMPFISSGGLVLRRS